MKKQVMIAALVLVFGLGTVAADTAQKFWIMPTAGVRGGGSFGISSEELAYTSFHFSSGFAYGLSFGYRASPVIAFEAMWSRHSSHVEGRAPASADGATPAVNEPLFKAMEDQFHANVLLSMGYLIGTVKPYFLFGFGMTAVNPDGDLSSVNRLSWSFGVGAEANLKDRFGLRVQGKFVPTYIKTTPEILLDWDGGFPAAPTRNNITQWELQAGLFYRF